MKVLFDVRGLWSVVRGQVFVDADSLQSHTEIETLSVSLEFLHSCGAMALPPIVETPRTVSTKCPNPSGGSATFPPAPRLGGCLKTSFLSPPQADE